MFRLGPGAFFSNRTADFFAPLTWAEYNTNDVDLCGSEPVVVDLPGTFLCRKA